MAYTLIAAFMNAVVGIFVKFIGQGVSTATVVFFRFGLCLLLLLPWFLKDVSMLRSSQLTKLVVRSVTGCLSLACMFYAMKYISLADALLLNNTSALFIPFIAWIVLRTHTPLSVWLSILFGFIGTVLVLDPHKGLLHVAAFVGLASGILSGISILQIRLLTKSTSTKQVLFYYFLTGTAISGLFLFYQWSPFNIHILWLLLGVGVSSVIFQVSIIWAYTYAPVRLVTPVMFITIVFGALFDWLIWHEIPTMTKSIGSLVVIISGLACLYFGAKMSEKKPDSK